MFSVALARALRAIKYATGHLDARITSAHLGVIRVLAIHVILPSISLVHAVERRSQFLAVARNKPNHRNVLLVARKSTVLLFLCVCVCFIDLISHASQ